MSSDVERKRAATEALEREARMYGVAFPDGWPYGLTKEAVDLILDPAHEYAQMYPTELPSHRVTPFSTGLDVVVDLDGEVVGIEVL